MELIVFTNNGSTYQFSNVTNFKNTSYGFSFDYFGKSTQKTSTAYFNNQSTAGYTILKDEKVKVMSNKPKLIGIYRDNGNIEYINSDNICAISKPNNGGMNIALVDRSQYVIRADEDENLEVVEKAIKEMGVIDDE